MIANFPTLFLLLCALICPGLRPQGKGKDSGSEAGARDQSASTPSSATRTEELNDAAKLIDQIEGVYKRRFQNALVSGEKYQDEDILEIVRVTQDAIYFRTHLGFFNGHVCNLNGVATYREGAFVFKDDPSNSKCVFYIKLTKDALEFADPDGSCRGYYCGVRGGFSGAKFPLKDRRAIRYMIRLKNSQEYTGSIKAFQADNPQRSNSPDHKP